MLVRGGLLRWFHKRGLRFFFVALSTALFPCGFDLRKTDGAQLVYAQPHYKMGPDFTAEIKAQELNEKQSKLIIQDAWKWAFKAKDGVGTVRVWQLVTDTAKIGDSIMHAMAHNSNAVALGMDFMMLPDRITGGDPPGVKSIFPKNFEAALKISKADATNILKGYKVGLPCWRCAWVPLIPCTQTGCNRFQA